MTHGTPNEFEKYNFPPLAMQLMLGTFEPIAVKLTLKESYAWMRLGGAQKVRDMITPPGMCVHCAEEKVWLSSYQGWFCYGCHSNLKHLGLLPYND